MSTPRSRKLLSPSCQRAWPGHICRQASTNIANVICGGGRLHVHRSMGTDVEGTGPGSQAWTTKNLEEFEALDGSSLNKGGLDKFKVYQEGQNRFHYGGGFEADQIRAREDDQAKETQTYGKQHSTVFKLLSATIIDVEPSTQSTLRCSDVLILPPFSSLIPAMKLDYQPLVIQRKYKNNHVRGSMSADETQWVLYLGQRCNLHANVTIEGTQATLIPSLDGHAQRYKAGENIVGWLGVYANFSDARAMFDVRKEMLASHLLLSVDTNLEILNQAIKLLLAKGLLWKEDENGQREQVVDVPRWNELYAKMKPTGPAGASLAHPQSVIMYTKVGGKEAWIMLIGDHAFRAEGEQGQDTLKATEVPSPELLEGPLYPLGTSVHFKDDAVMQDAFRKICAIRPGSKLVFIKQALEVLLEEGALFDLKGKQHSSVDAMYSDFKKSVSRKGSRKPNTRG
ncbi:hypothetical protein F5876DRAFT_70012 [Lentinula aff. lateritia]|uniref:Uncharacterized protein n=1 Tax=Lentinula aff. lateritia TaxID=2804960 RepID=A0ACC1TL01_9AGAR|nr:hypothetical protein F5876DRAFT_70012 [Lentinula aff. lateritia]